MNLIELSRRGTIPVAEMAAVILAISVSDSGALRLGAAMQVVRPAYVSTADVAHDLHRFVDWCRDSGVDISAPLHERPICSLLDRSPAAIEDPDAARFLMALRRRGRDYQDMMWRAVTVV